MMNVHEVGSKPVITFETTKFFARFIAKNTVQKSLQRNTFEGGEVQTILLYGSMLHHEDVFPQTYEKIRLWNGGN